MNSFTGLLALVLVAAAPVAAHAQDAAKPRAEIGVRGGLSVYSREGAERVSVLGIPGGTLFSTSTLYAMMFVRPQVALEPQVGIVRVGTEGGSSGLFTGALQVNQFFDDPSAGAAFGLLNLGFTTGIGGGTSSTLYAAGGGAGYRTILSETLGVRLEGRYRRLFGDEGPGSNEFSILVGLGAVLGNSR